MPLSNCWKNWVTESPTGPRPTEPPGHRAETCGEGRAMPAPLRCAFLISRSAVEGVGLDRHPGATLDLVNGEHLVGGVAVLVEGHVSGHTGEVRALDRVHDCLADRGVDGLLAR